MDVLLVSSDSQVIGTPEGEAQEILRLLFQQQVRREKQELKSLHIFLIDLPMRPPDVVSRDTAEV